MYLLTGDIGGTHSRFRLLERSADGWLVLHQESCPSKNFASLAEAAGRYLDIQLGKKRMAVRAAWFAVAGPVQNGGVAFTNLPWLTNAAELATELKVPSVHLVNDLEAQAHAVPFARGDQVHPIQRGVPKNDRMLLVSAGTGLGMATLWMENGNIEAFCSEGGHSDLAPVTEDHISLLCHLRRRLEHVSYERVLSGPGLATLYDFVCQREDGKSPLEEQPSLSPATIAGLASDGEPLAAETVELFVQLLGGFVGNAALQWLARGGVYLTGGVILGLRPFIATDVFLNAFHHKGRMSPLMKQMPVSIVACDDAGLQGVTHLAIRDCG